LRPELPVNRPSGRFNVASFARPTQAHGPDDSLPGGFRGTCSEQVETTEIVEARSGTSTCGVGIARSAGSSRREFGNGSAGRCDSGDHGLPVGDAPIACRQDAGQQRLEAGLLQAIGQVLAEKAVDETATTQGDVPNRASKGICRELDGKA
jgi:hypothetical protein